MVMLIHLSLPHCCTSCSLTGHGPGVGEPCLRGSRLGAMGSALSLPLEGSEHRKDLTVVPGTVWDGPAERLPGGRWLRHQHGTVVMSRLESVGICLATSGRNFS